MNSGQTKRWSSKLDRLIDSQRMKIREKAIGRAKSRIVLNGHTVSDYSPDDLEILVKEEEDKIKQSLKEKGFLAALALIGFNSF